MIELEELSSLAQVALIAERYFDASKYIEELIKKKKEDLTKEEKNIFYKSFKYVVNSKRSAWLSINYLEEKEKNDERMEIIKNYKNIIEKDILEICKNVITLINNFLLTKAVIDESKMFYLKMKGDYYRYLCEFKALNENKNYLEESEKNYKNAIELSQNISWIGTIKLGLYLNYSVFIYEIKKDTKKAIQIAKEAVKSAKKYSDKIKEEEDKDAEITIQVLKENINYWEED